MGRPKLPPGHKKVKINVALDPDVFEYLKSLENRSHFVNQATRILMKAYQSAAKRNPAKKESARASEKSA